MFGPVLLAGQGGQHLDRRIGGAGDRFRIVIHGVFGPCPGRGDSGQRIGMIHNTGGVIRKNPCFTGRKTPPKKQKNAKNT